MSGTLYLWLSDDRVQWMVRGPDAFRRAESGSLEQVAAHAAGHRVVVLVPVADVLLTEARLSARHTRHLRQAVPFAIEEQLSDEVERLHFALASKRTAEGAQPVAVVSRARMQQWLAQLASAGLHPNSLVPDVLALPLATDEWTLLIQPSGAVLRTSPTKGYALDLSTLDKLLGLAFSQDEGNRPSRLRMFACGHEAAASVRAVCAEAQVEVVEGACGEGPLGVVAAELARPAAIDLMQGEFSRREHLGKLWRPWRTAAALLAVWLLLQIGIGIYHFVTLTGESEALQAQIEAVYRRAFPEARNVANPRLQMEQHLARLRGGGGSGGFVTLMAKAAPILHGEVGLELTALRFKDGVLDVDLTVRDFQSMDRLKQALAGQELQVEVQNASARGGKTEGRLRLREGR